MFRVFVFSVLTLRPFLNVSSEAVRPSGREASAWIVGRVDASGSSVLGLCATSGRDLDPAACAARGLHQGFQPAELSCSSHELQEPVFINTSSRGESQDETRSCLYSSLCVGQGMEAAFLSRVVLSTRPSRVQAGQTFVVEVSGNLAGPPNQPTGVVGVGQRNLSCVTVDFQDVRSRSSRHVNVSDDGSFTVTFEWTFESPGKQEINVRVSNPLSTLSSTLHLSVLHGPLGVPFPQTDLFSVVLHRALLRGPGSLQDHLAAGFCWWFSEERSDMDLKTCLMAAYDGLNSTLMLSESDLQLFPTVTQLLALNLTLKTPKHEEKTKQDVNSCTDGNTGMETNISENQRHSTHHQEVCGYCSNHSGFRLHLQHSCLLPTSAEDHHLVASVFFSLLTQDSGLYEHICVLRRLVRWISVNPTSSDFSLEVVSHTKSEELQVVWTLTLDKRTTEGWNINMCLLKAGCYKATVEAFNPFSQTSFHTHISVKDPAGKLVVNTPSVTTTDRKLALLFSVTGESNVSVSLLANSTTLYRHSSYAKGEEAVVVLLLNHTGTVAVELRAENRVCSQNKSVKVCIKGNRKQPPQVKVNPNWQPPTSVFLSSADTAVRIHSAKQAYPTNADITLMVLADVQVPAEFIWHFGDSKSVRTTSRSITTRYNKPGRFDVVVVMVTALTSVTSQVLPLEIQRAVKLNRLVHEATVLQNHTLTVSCRVNAGTNLTFLWSFGDGSYRLGGSTEQHVYPRTGEVRIEVTVSNLVSSASLSSLLFVVDRPCQPAPVKNMGPLQVEVWRYEVVHLGVTYENELDCDLTGGLLYTWTLFDSAGQVFPLPSIHTHRQSLVLPSHFLHYDTYTAVARVQVSGSVVYSNYSVRVKVLPSPLVAFIQGGTNIYINNRNSTMVTLDGQRSYDPDFPFKPLSYSWTCEPVSSVSSSCFNQHIPTSSPGLTFPVGLLKRSFDQFRFTLTVHSREHSASSETFLTVAPHVLGKVSVRCPQCRGDQVSWAQPFSVRALCEDCDAAPERIQYSWRLYLVNASSKPVTAAFCHAVDLIAPSPVMEGPATSPQAPSAVHPVNYTLTPVPLRESSSEARANNRHGDSDSGTTSKRGRNPSKKAGEDLLHRPLGEFSGVLYSDHFGEVSSEFPNDSDSSADWEFSSPALEAEDAGDADYDISLTTAEEGDPGISAGRPTGEDGETFHVGDDSELDSELHRDEGSNLVDSGPPVVIQEKTLLDLHRDPLDPHIFESYTYTGTSSSLLSVRPFSLGPGRRYMLEVTAKCHDNLLGRTQLFLKTKPAPKEVLCQVQPVKGTELHTQFSIFCSSGKADLLYEYSFSVGGNRPRVLYQGRDFQHYFRLPSGDSSDDHKVTIYTELKSADGTATKPCPVTVQVQPRFLRESSPRDPVLELAESGLRNLSALVRFGNVMEIRNYVSLLSIVLNRLSLDAEANTPTHTHIRSALIRTLCELESSEQLSMEDNICVLNDVLKITNQVSFASARRVLVHIQRISDQFLDSRAPVQYNVDHKTLSTLITLLSHTLQAAANGHYSTVESSHGVAKQVAQLVADIHRTASDLMLKYILFHKTLKHRVTTSSITLYATNQNSTVVSSGSTTFHLPASLIQQLFERLSAEKANRPHPPCLLSVLTEFTHNPFTWASYPTKLNGPVVSLNLYQCGSRRKIHIHSSIQPISVEPQHMQRNMSSVHEYILLHNQVHYHSFNITQQHLQQAIQFSVVFKPQSNKAFPVMVLFRMFDRPTPSMHHLHRIHHWEINTTRITLPPSYLSASGVGHLALLNGGKAPKHKHLNAQISYSLTVDSSLCLSWDSHQGAWTRHGCRTQQADTGAAVSCRCHQLRPLTVVQDQLQGSHDTADVDLFISVSSDLTVPGVLILFVCLYILGLLQCRKSDVISEQGQPVHYLPDNSPLDPYLYAVTIHTGLCSAACMSAKVYIVLQGEDSVSQTKELQVPGCTLFRRNCKDTFIISTADILGPVWGVHIWHDNSGPTPNWFLKRVEVSEVDREHGEARAWLFIGQCWLAVSKGDGLVEKKLRVCTQGVGFSKMLCLKLWDYLADFHIWMSVLSCPRPNPFTHTQRLTVCLLLLLGYACVNTVMISRMDNQLPFELGFIDVSAVSVRMGFLSVLAVLPAATVISFLFRWREMQLMGPGDGLSRSDRIPGVQQQTPGHKDTDLSVFTMNLENKDTQKEPEIDPHVSLRTEGAPASRISMGPALQNVLEITEEKRWKTLDKGSKYNENQNDSLSGGGNENQSIEMEKESQGRCFWNLEEACCGHSIINKLRGTSQWCHYVAWMLCLLLSLLSLVLSTVLGMRFSSAKVLIWIHSFFFSLISCIFLIHPVLISVVAVIVSLWYEKEDIHGFLEVSKVPSCKGSYWPKHGFSSSNAPQKTCSHFQEQLRARQRARHLRLARPPTTTELRKRRRETLRCENFRDLSVCVSMLCLMLCITYSSSFNDHYHLNQFVRNHHKAFMSIQTPEDWWKWMQTGLLNALYKNVSAKTEHSCILIGEPTLWRREAPRSFHSQVSDINIKPSFLLSSRALTYLNPSVKTPGAPSSCSQLRCYSEPDAAVGLGFTESDAASNLKRLHSGGWLNRSTLALKVRFTLYSPAPDLFTSVALLTEQSPTGVLQPSTEIRSARVYHTPAVWDYVAMTCQLLFLLLSLLQLCHQVATVAQQGLLGSCRIPCSWLEAFLLTASLVYYVYYIYHSVITVEVAELLQRHNHKGHVDVNPLASCEQHIRSLRGVTLFLLSVKCVTLLRVNRTLLFSAALLTRSLTSLFWPMISSLILLVALSCAGNLLFVQNSWSFSSVPRSLQTLLCYRGLLTPRYEFRDGGVLYLFFTVMWRAAMMGLMISTIRSSRRSRGRWTPVFTVAELVRWVGQRFSQITFHRNPTWTDNNTERWTYYLEEFESLADELLFKVNALSDSLHHNLHPRARRYMEELPVTPPLLEVSSVDTEDFVRIEMMEETSTTEHNDVTGHGEILPTSHLHRLKLKLKILQLLELQTFSESASLRGWTEDVLEKKANQWTGNKNNCWLKSQATHAGVVVEAQVHEVP